MATVFVVASLSFSSSLSSLSFFFSLETSTPSVFSLDLDLKDKIKDFLEHHSFSQGEGTHVLDRNRTTNTLYRFMLSNTLQSTLPPRESFHFVEIFPPTTRNADSIATHRFTCFSSVFLISLQGEVADFISRTLTIDTLVVLQFILHLFEDSS